MAYLVLQNGRVLEGKRFGAQGAARGELVFVTSMNAYLETITDPKHDAQMVVQTFPLIGNYGVIPAEWESERAHLSAYVVRSWCDAPSNFRSEGNVDAFLRAQGVPGLCGVDTRTLTRMLRDAGTMQAALVDTLPASPLSLFDAPCPQANVAHVTCAVARKETPPNAHFRVVVYDFGVQRREIDALLARGCEVVQTPAGTTVEQAFAYAPDGIVLSGGPGDPISYPSLVAEIGKLARTRLPILGVGLGHQLLALSCGARTEKLKFGHRGANQPVRDAETGRLYTTDQNHGYVVSMRALPDHATARWINANDGTCEGLTYTALNAFSVQFAPEAYGGSVGTSFLWDAFVERLGGACVCR